MMPLLAFVLLAVTAAGGAAVMRRARCPGWAVVGGAIAGVVLGPTIFGRVLPDAYESLFVGGAKLRSHADVARAVSEQTGGGAHGAADSAAVTAWRAAQWDDQRPMRLTVCAIAGLVLAGGGMATAGRDRRQGWIAPASIGAWAALLPAGVLAAMAIWWWRTETAPALVAAAAVAIGPWILTPGDREAADRAEYGGAAMILSAGRVATLIAIVLAGAGWWRLEGPRGLVWALPLLPAVWPLRRALPRAAEPVFDRVMHGLLIPMLAASVTLVIDLFTALAAGPILVALVVSGDGRWIGAFTGAMLPGGRRPLRTMRLILGCMAAGPTQVAVTAIAIHTWTLDAELALALLTGAILIEVTAPVRRRMDRQTQEAEEMAESRE